MGVAASTLANEITKKASVVAQEETVSGGLYQPKGDYITPPVGDQRYQPKGSYYTTVESDDKFQLKGAYVTQAEADEKYIGTTERASFMKQTDAYTKSEVDKFLQDFRNSLGLPATSPFPTDNVITTWDKSAVYAGIDVPGNDIPGGNFNATKGVTDAQSCFNLCKTNHPTITKANEYNDSNKDCWCKFSTGEPVNNAAWTTRIANNVPRTSSLRIPAGGFACLDTTGASALTYSAGATAAQTFTRLNPCTGMPSQIWSYDPQTRQLKNGQGGQCLQLRPDGGLELANCSTSEPRQQFTMDNLGRFVSASNGKCIDLDGDTAKTARPVGTWQCFDNGNQKLYPSSEWATYPDQNIPNWGDVSNAPATDLADCRRQCSAKSTNDCEVIVYDNNSKVCWQKSRSKQPNANIVHLIKYPGNEIRYTNSVDQVGFDLGTNVNGVASAMACGDICKKDPKCQTAAYDKVNKLCYPKAARPLAGSTVSWRPVGAWTA